MFILRKAREYKKIERVCARAYERVRQRERGGKGWKKGEQNITQKAKGGRNVCEKQKIG